jgi:hypothetical protein
VISNTLKSAWDCYAALSGEAKAAARRAYAIFEQTPEHLAPLDQPRREVVPDSLRHIFHQ